MRIQTTMCLLTVSAGESAAAGYSVSPGAARALTTPK